MLGKFLIYSATIFAVLSIISFLLVHFGRDKMIKFGRIFYNISAASVIAASAFLLFNILDHQFQYTYVWEQSNRELGLALLISTFYSGQEGSFMLWTFMTAVIGIFLMRYLVFFLCDTFQKVTDLNRRLWQYFLSYSVFSLLYLY